MVAHADVWTKGKIEVKYPSKKNGHIQRKAFKALA